jgi:antitoxin CptB
MVGSERVRKLRWLCRRGMKELDVLLERFIERNDNSLANGSWPELETLLQTEDDVLWDWFQNTSDPDAAAYREILEQILHARG